MKATLKDVKNGEYFTATGNGFTIYKMLDNRFTWNEKDCYLTERYTDKKEVLSYDGDLIVNVSSLSELKKAQTDTPATKKPKPGKKTTAPEKTKKPASVQKTEQKRKPIKKEVVQDWEPEKETRIEDFMIKPPTHKKRISEVKKNIKNSSWVKDSEKQAKKLEFLTTYQAVIDNFNDLQTIATGLMKTKTIVEWSNILKCSRTTIYAKQKDKGFTSRELSTIFKNTH